MRSNESSDYPSQLNLLIDQLDELRQRGGPSRVFLSLEGSGPLDLPILFDAVRRLRPELWANEGQRVEAIRRVLADAIHRGLQAHALPGSNGALSWRQAALILFDVHLPPEAKEAIQTYTGHKHARLARYVREAAALFPPDGTNKRKDERTFQGIVLDMREKMAEAILSAVPDDSGQSVAGNEQDSPPAPSGEKKKKQKKSGVSIGYAASVITGDNAHVVQTNHYHGGTHTVVDDSGE